MTELFFYKIDEAPINALIHTIAAGCRRNGWRLLVDCHSTEQANNLSRQLWSAGATSFMPSLSVGIPSKQDIDATPIIFASSDYPPTGFDCITTLLPASQPPDNCKRLVSILSHADPARGYDITSDPLSSDEPSGDELPSSEQLASSYPWASRHRYHYRDSDGKWKLAS